MRLPGGESSTEAMKRGVSVLEEVLEQPATNIAIVTHGNLLCLMLRYYNKAYGFAEWKNMTNPDVFELVFHSKKTVSIQRIWK